MEPMHTPETAPTPAERAARHWLLLMGVVVVVVTVATGIWFLTSRDDPAVTPVAEPGAAAGVTITVPPESEYDFFELGPRIRVTEDEGVATGTIEVTANGRYYLDGDWIETANAAGLDGAALLEDLKATIAKYSN